MITDKRRRYLCVFIVGFIFVLSCVLVSCSKKTDNTLLEALATLNRDEQFELDDTEADTEDIPKAEYYRIVISGMCSSETAAVARTLAERIEEKTGIDCGVVYDSDDFPKRENAVEILLGNTDRDASAIALEDMLRDDYVCGLVGDSLVIGGLSDSATVTAAERFMSELLPLAEGMYLIEETGGFEYFAKYELSSVTLCGFDIGDYDIVCAPRATEDERLFVNLIKELVADKSGICIDTKYSLGGEYGKKEIILSVDTQADTPVACVKEENEDVVISGSDTYCLSVAVSKFCDMLLEGVSDGRASINIDGRLELPCGDTRMKFMSVLSDVRVPSGNLTPIVNISEYFNAAMPDIAVIGSMSPTAWEYIKYNLHGFAYVEQLAGGDPFMPMLYRSDSVRAVSVSGERKDGVELQKVIFEKKAGGERFTVFSFVCPDGVEVSKLIKTVTDTVKDTPNAIAVVTAPQSAAGSFVISDGRMTVCYNRSVSVGDRSFFSSLLVSSDQCLYSDMGTEYGDKNDICYISSTVGKKYCAQLLTLLSENTVH